MVGNDVDTLSAYDPQMPMPKVAHHPALFRVLEAERPMTLPSRHSLDGVDVVVLGRGAPGIDRAAPRHLVIRVADPRMSGTHAELRWSGSEWLLEDKNSKNGTIVNGERRNQAVLEDGDVVELGWTFFVFRGSVAMAAGQPLDLAPNPAPDAQVMATLNPTLARSFLELSTIARTQLSVLIRGETGTGKELAARALHKLSGRPGDFVAINCASIPQNLVESELFGYRKGAFSGAMHDHPGLVRASHQGTLFLDEIGDMPAPAQAALLRVLQERQVLPVGTTRPIDVDLRVCAATHRDVDALVRSGGFREDLMARISGFVMNLPPLRERREDLGLLVRALLQHKSNGAAERIRFVPPAVRKLLAYDWPRNVRELEKTIERSVALATDGVIHPEHLGDLAKAQQSEAADDGDPSRKAELERLLERHHGNISAVAREMGKDRVQIRRWMKRYGLREP